MSQPAIRQPIPVGKYFLDLGKITQQQLELALAHRSEFGLKLGQSLVELGLVTETDMVEALRYQSRFPCIHLTSGIVDPRIAAKLGELESRRLRAIALNQIAGHTTIALEDPSDQQALEELSHILATRILPVYAEASAIRKCQERVFGVPKRSAKPAAPPAKDTAPRAAPSATVPVASVRLETANQPEPEPEEEAPADERAVVDNVRAILQQAFEQGAKAIHLEARCDGLVVRFRSGGALREHSRLPAGWLRQTIGCLKSLAKIDPAESAKSQQGTVPFLFRKQHIEVRVSTTPTLHGESAVLRIHGGGPAQRDFAQLGLSEEQVAELEPILMGRPGLIVLVGPAGSGRRTTFRALLTRLANSPKKVVALLSDTEPEFPGVTQVQIDPAVGLDGPEGIRTCLLQDPDLLFVQEGGQRETAQGLLDVALAGTGIVTTLRSRSALQILVALQSLGLEPYLLAEALRGVVAQRLVRAICPDCKAAIVADHLLAERLGLTPDGATYYEGAGCDACHGTGYRGSFAVFEVLEPKAGLRRELEKGSSPEIMARAARADGFQDLRVQALHHARAGRTTLPEVLRAIAGG